MFDWLYKKAGNLKKVTYFTGGLGVAVSTVIGKVSSTTSWIANLSAIALGGAAYSTLKNMEVAESIMEKEREIVHHKELLSLQDYPIKPAGFDSPANVLRTLHHDDAAHIITNAERAQIDLNRRIPTPRKYAYINAALQIVPSIFIIIVNTLANLESTQANSEDSSRHLSGTGWSTIQWLNLFGVSACIALQYSSHTFYTASNLRGMANRVEGLNSLLAGAQNSTMFRAAKVKAFRLSCADIAAQQGQCNAEIANTTQHIDGLSQRIADSEQQLSRFKDDIANEQSKLVTYTKDLRKCEIELGEIESELPKLVSDAEKNAGKIKELIESKDSLIEKQTEISRETKETNDRRRTLREAQKTLEGDTQRIRTERDKMEETLDALQRNLATLEERRTQLISKKPEKMEEFVNDLARSRQLAQI